MKKLLLVAGLTVFLFSCGPTQNEAIKYNDAIMDMIDNLAVEHTLFLNQIDGHNIDSLQLTHKLFAAKAKSSLEESNKIAPFANKKEFSDVAHEYFTALNSIANNEGKEMVDIMSKDSTQITQADLDKINALATKFDADYSKVYDKIRAEQIRFSKEWHFDLETKTK